MSAGAWDLSRRFGYRVNALGGNGETFVRNSDLTRKMVSLAGDVRPFDRTVVEAFYSHYNLEQRGFPGWFTYGRANRNAAFVLVPEDAPDPAREGYGQPQAGVDLESRIGQLRVRHELNRNWRLSVGALDQLVERDISTQVNALTDNAGNYTASLASGFAPRFRVFSNLSHRERASDDRARQARRGDRRHRLHVQDVFGLRESARGERAPRHRQHRVAGRVRPAARRDPDAREPLSLQRDSSAGRERRRQRRARTVAGRFAPR